MHILNSFPVACHTSPESFLNETFFQHLSLSIVQRAFNYIRLTPFTHFSLSRKHSHIVRYRDTSPTPTFNNSLPLLTFIRCPEPFTICQTLHSSCTQLRELMNCKTLLSSACFFFISNTNLFWV